MSDLFFLDDRIIERLYEPCKRWKRCKDTRYEAADEIERLREHYDKHLDDRAAWQAEIERLREALARIANHPGGHPDSGEPLRDIAREALRDD